MRYRRFGTTDLEVSEVTFGAMRFVAGNMGQNDEQTGKRALEAALDGGITTIHSSYEYGTRWALGDVLQGHPRRHELHHVIKVTVPDFTDSGFDAAKFRGQVEDALRDLHAERIAVVQHLQRGVANDVIYGEAGDAPRIAAMPEVNAALLETFAQLKREGKVGWLATFPYTPGFAEAAIESGAFHGMVAFFNLIETEMVPLLDAMRERGMGYFTMRPFLQGLLTDKRAGDVHLPPGDAGRRRAWEAYYPRFARLQEELGAEVRSWSDLAIKFALADPLMCSVILSMNTPEQVAGVLAAADGDYPDAALVRRVAAINGHI
jgi:aryl-alcohol dehydrogenase-like predicted oxidoreductase